MATVIGAAIVGSLGLIGGTSLVAANAVTAPGHACTATYSVKRAWSTGFSAQVTVKNTGAEDVRDWAVDWTQDGLGTAVEGWRGTWTADNGRISVKGGGSLSPGRPLRLNYIGWHPAGTTATPNAFELNGVRCRLADTVEESDLALPPGASASPLPGPPHSTTSSRRAPSAPAGALYVDSAGPVVDWLAANSGDSRAALIRSRIESEPQARWFGNGEPEGVTSQVRSYTSRAAARGKTPILVAYNMTNRDCGGASAGGAGSADEYRSWISAFAAGLGRRTSIIVLEPDALPHLTGCLSASQQSERLSLMSYAGQVIKAANPRARLYYDIGHSNWLSVSDADERLRGAGATTYADGIALNTSNYNTSADEVAYGKQVLAGLGIPRLQMVVDTSRNGAGPAGAGEWCDPAGRKLGTDPTTRTGDAEVAAFLWVKRPGESDGCSGPAGQFIPETAYSLAE